MANTLLISKLISNRVEKVGGRTLLAGACVRNRFFGVDPDSVDVEVYDINCKQLYEALEGLNVNLTGDKTGVVATISIDSQDFNVSIPDFAQAGLNDESFVAEFVPLQEINSGDFTINTLRLLMNENLSLSDEFNGLSDIRRKRLRAASSKFTETPISVLRGMCYAGRFRMTMEPETVDMCEKMASNFGAIPKNQVWHQFYNLMSRGVSLSRGLSLLKTTGWLKLFPELYAMDACNQDLAKYVDSNVWENSIKVCDAALEIAIREQLPEEERLVLLFSALLHSVGKPASTVDNGEGLWVSFGQAKAGVAPAKSFLRSIDAPDWLIEKVLPLVGGLVHESLPSPNETIVQNLVNRLSPATVEEWGYLTEAFNCCMRPRPKSNPIQDYLVIAKELATKASKPERILSGELLKAEFGMEEGEEVGKVLDESYQKQLKEGWTTTDQALSWARVRLSKF